MNCFNEIASPSNEVISSESCAKTRSNENSTVSDQKEPIVLVGVKLEKIVNTTGTATNLRVLQPQEDDLILQFKTDYFQKNNDDPGTNINFKPLLMNLEKNELKIKQTVPLVENEVIEETMTVKLPLGVELTAGPGSSHHKSEQGKNIKIKSPLPSDMLLASASLLRSYLGFTQDKDLKNEPENDESMKEKMVSLWHNMKYGWSASIKTNFSREIPIYLLGKEYHKSYKEDSAFRGSGFACSDIEGFKHDFGSIPWFTYRRKFPILPNSTLTSDCGWGCMIRSGQMMVATALSRHFLPPGWRYSCREEGAQTSIHRQIMKWFCDSPSSQSPLSIHNLVALGHKMNKKAGNWYGPSCVAHIFKEAISEGAKTVPALDRIAVYVAQDGAIYIQDVLDICSASKCLCREEKSLGAHSTNPSFDHCTDATLDSDIESSYSEPYSMINKYGQEEDFPVDLFVNSNREMDNRKSSLSKEQSLPVPPASKSKTCEFCQEWKSCLILIPVRLGGSHVNPIYYNCICSFFLHDLCIGIIGGRPKHSLYFVGFQENSLIHLDPHFNQDALSLDDPFFPLASYHCSSPKKISLSKMDPSATIGFYCHTKSQFLRIIEELPSVATARDGNIDSPIFEFINGKSSDINGWLNRTLDEESARISMVDTPPPSLEESEIVCLD